MSTAETPRDDVLKIDRPKRPEPVFARQKRKSPQFVWRPSIGRASTSDCLLFGLHVKSLRFGAAMTGVFCPKREMTMKSIAVCTPVPLSSENTRFNHAHPALRESVAGGTP